MFRTICLGVTSVFVVSVRRLTHAFYNLYWTVEMLMTRDGPAVIDAKARYSSRLILSFE